SVDRSSGERMDPGRAEQPGGRGDVPGHIFHTQGLSPRLYQADVDSPLPKTEPGQNGRWKIAAHQQNLIARSPPHTIGQQVQPVGVAVSEDNLLGRNLYQFAESLFEPLWYGTESLRGQVPGSALPGDRFFGRLRRHAGKGALVGTIEPD